MAARAHGLSDPAQIASSKDVEFLERDAAEARFGYLEIQLEARQALGELEFKSHHQTVGRNVLAALEKEATAKGFLLIAHKAALARESDRRAALPKSRLLAQNGFGRARNHDLDSPESRVRAGVISVRFAIRRSILQRTRRADLVG
jgi:hypothetical protein